MRPARGATPFERAPKGASNVSNFLHHNHYPSTCLLFTNRIPCDCASKPFKIGLTAFQAKEPYVRCPIRPNHWYFNVTPHSIVLHTFSADMQFYVILCKNFVARVKVSANRLMRRSYFLQVRVPSYSYRRAGREGHKLDDSTGVPARP